MSEVAWSYIAGFWEGEGCGGIYKRRDRHHKNSFRLEVALSQKNPQVLYWIKSYCGYGYICRKKDGVHMWRISHRQAKSFLAQIYPYLKFRQDHVASLLNFYKK